MNPKLPHITLDADFCVVGGGLAGLLAAVSAARGGAKVVLMQDRPVLGGNASSEVRMWVRGANGEYDHESGILEELELNSIARNPGCNFSLWDSVLYELAVSEPNLTLLLSCSCLDAEADGGRVVSVTGWQLTTYTYYTVRARLFADCSGDSVLAPLVGAEYRVGREAAGEFGEDIEPPVADSHTMGLSCMLQARETDRPVAFTPPSFAEVYPDDSAFPCRGHDLTDVFQNYWWLELGGDTDSLHDAERVRERLLAVAFGVWDHIKNRGDHGAANWELEWVGFLPGKRESRRYVGDHILTQNDVASSGHFADTVAYGGWSMDDHHPAGFRYPGAPNINHPAPSPFGIPYRCLYSANVENLFFAGRNISATHIALSATRVMATCAVMGQAVGTAAALCLARGVTPRALGETAIGELQQRLLDAGCFLPGFRRSISPLAHNARYGVPTGALFDGLDRDRPEAAHRLTLPVGGRVEMRWDAPVRVERLRVALDSDLRRLTVSDSPVLRRFPMRSNIPLDFAGARVPATLVKRLAVDVTLASGAVERVFAADDNHAALLFVPIAREITALSASFDETWGAETVGVFGFDVL